MAQPMAYLCNKRENMDQNEVIAALTAKNLDLEEVIRRKDCSIQAYKQEGEISLKILREIAAILGYRGYIGNLPNVVMEAIDE